MKNKLTYSLLLAAASCGVALGQTTAYTSPVGYITIPLPGTGGTTPQKLQISNQGLLPGGGPAYAGAAESFGSDGTGPFLQDDQGTWAAGAYVNGTRVSHVVIVTSGPMKGSMTWITSSTANKLYTSDSLVGAGEGATFSVYMAYNITSLLGDPPTPAVFQGGSAQGTSDNLQILDPTTNTYQTFWYKNSGVGGTGWRATGIANADVPTTALFPNDGLVLTRKQSAAGSLVLSGAVVPGNIKVAVEGNPATTVLNIIATQIPTNQLTPGNSGLYTGNVATGLKGGSAQGTADNVLIFDAATNTYTTFWYKDSGVGGTGWRATGVADPTNFVIPGTAAILIQRKNGTTFSWNVPGVTIGQ